jgi:hypothetical protein
VSTGAWAGLVLAALLTFAAAPASATSGGCFFPSDVPNFFSDDFFDEVELAEHLDACQLQCNDFRVGCKLAVKGSYKCFVAFVESVFGGESLTCDEIEDSETRKACKNAAKSDRQGLLDDLSQQKEEGLALCESLFEDCLDDCETVVPEE